MKIAIVGPAYPFRGGIADFNERMAFQFQEEGNEVKIFTFTTQYPDFLFPGKTQFSESSAPEGLEIERVISSVNPFSWLRAGKKVRNWNPDLVIVRFWLPFMGPSLGTMLRVIKKQKNIQVICLVDNMIPHESRAGDKQFTQYFIKPVDAFFAMTQSVLDDIRKFDKKKHLGLSPHPLYDHFGEIQSRESALQQLNLDPDYQYLLFFGLIRDYKGLDLLLEAMNNSEIKSRKIKLIIAGEYYSDKEKYSRFIRDNNLEDSIIQIDQFIPNDQVAHYFNAASLVVQPYKTATQSGVTQIAYHFNKPMVVTNVGGLPEMCPDQKVGFVVDKNANEIAKAIISYFDQSLEEKFVQGILEEKKKYDWSILTKNMLKLKSLI